MSRARGRLGTVLITAVVTSGAWLGGLAFWSVHHANGDQPARAPAQTLIGPPPAAPPAAIDRGGTGATTLLLPVVGITRAQLVDTYTQARAGGARQHDAIDIMAPRGTPVIAAAAGKVEKLFLSRDGGNTIYVRSPDGRLIYYYAHLDSYAPQLAEGQEISAGTPLGTVGTTGNADPNGPHLHFAMAAADPAGSWFQEAPALNPYPWLMRGERPTPDQVPLAQASPEAPGSAERRQGQ